MRRVSKRLLSVTMALALVLMAVIPSAANTISGDVPADAQNPAAEAGAGEIALPESEQNYANDADETWTYTVEGAENGIYVTFDEQTETENNYDFLYVMDGNDDQIGRYTGKTLAGQTLYIPTAAVKIRLTSDGSSVKWGFAVTAAEAAGETIDLEKVGSIDAIAPVFVGEQPDVVVRVNGNVIANSNYTVACSTAEVGETAATVNGTGSYSGTLSAKMQVVDQEHLLTGAEIFESNISLRQSGDRGSSYVGLQGADETWVSAVESITLKPVEADGETAVNTGSIEYPKAPKEITLKKDDVTLTTSRITFARTAEEPVVYVMEGHDPIDIQGRWSTNTYPQSQKYLVTVKAKGYEDSTGVVTYYTGTAPAFSIIVDEDGSSSTTDDRRVEKSWSSAELAELAEFANGSSQCGMTGFRTFSGEGVSIKKLLELAGTEVSDSDYFLLDTSDHYGNYFTYDDLFGVDRYFLSTIYSDEFKAFYKDLVESDSDSGSIVALRRYLAEHASDADKIEPRVNTSYLETSIAGSELQDAVLPTEETTEYNDLVNYENQFRYFYGVKLVEEDCNLTFDSQGGTEVAPQLVKSHLMTSTENTTMKSSYWANSLVIFRGAGEDHQTEPSEAANTITRPADPTRVGYTFEGWYTDPECTDGNEFDFSANDKKIDEDTQLYAKWSEGSTLPESDHNYGNNVDRTYSFDIGEEAENGIVVTFSEETSTESGYDFITILDADNNELGKYSGTELAGKSVYVPTSKVFIRLTSDRSSDDWGFKVESIEPNGETIDLEKFGEIGKINAVEVNGTPVVPVTVNGTELVKDTDYTVEADTSEAGVKTAKVTGIGKYSGTLSKNFVVYTEAVRITDYTISSAEHDDADGELNQTIIATITFDKNIQMTAEDLKDELDITIACGNAYNTARDITFKAEGNKLIITMVSNDWVAIYNGVLAISESDNNLTHLTGMTEGSAVIWETQSDNIPIGIVVQNEMTAGTADAAASTAVEVTHKANMRGMYHFQLVSIVNGEETVVAQGTSHAHAFYTSITKESIAKAIASFVDKQDGYSAVYNDGEATFTMTADEAVEGQTIAIRMFENKMKIRNALPESDHNYANNADETYSYTCKNAENGVIVTFSEDTKTEAGYDFITILDADGNELGKYSGTELAGRSVYVPTATVGVHFTSDRSSVDYGFRVVSIVPNGDTVDLEKFGEIGKIDPVEVNGAPVVPVTVNGTELVKDTDYTVETDTSEAGVKTAKVTGIGKYSGTLSKDFVVYTEAVRITDYTISSTEHDDADGELNQTIIATITFDKDVKMTAEDLKDELNITIAGGNAYNTARDITFKAEGNKLIITMVSNDWVAIYNGVLAISESDNNLTHLTGMEKGSAVVWETQSDNIPIGIVVVNDPTAGTADAAASTAVEVTHKANMRGMYHFQLVSIVNGEETVIAQGTSHAHAFYTSITKESIAKAIASFVDKQDGYSAVYNDGEATFTMTADEAVEGQTIAIRMFENKAQINYKKDIEAAAAVEDLIEAIGEVDENSGEAIAAAKAAYDALTDDQKARVSEEAAAALEVAEAAYEEIQTAKANAEAAEAAEKAIADIGTVTLDSKEKIDAAKAAYEALTDDQKALVSDASKKALSDAEAAYEELVKADEKAKADQAAAEAVEKAINDIGPVKKESADAVKAARDAYNALTDDQKKLVSEDAVKTLEAAEAAIEALNNNQFTDVPENSYFADAVGWAVMNSITKGTSDTTFSPHETCTRGQMVTFLYRAAGSPAVTSTKNPFVDVKEGSYYYNAVLWAVQENITKGEDPTHFGPDNDVSRGQAVTFLYRKDGEKAVSSANPFTDVSSSSFCYNAVLWASENGVAMGTTDKTFEPNETCERAHIVTFLYRYLG